MMFIILTDITTYRASILYLRHAVILMQEASGNKMKSTEQSARTDIEAQWKSDTTVSDLALLTYDNHNTLLKQRKWLPR